MRTPDEVKEILQIRELSITEWVRENAFTPKPLSPQPPQVQQIL